MKPFFKLSDFNVAGKKVLVRVDFNVPLDAETKQVANDKRIKAALPTIQHLLDNGARVILCSHFGRPNGVIVDDLRLDPIAHHLSTLLEKEVLKLNDCIGNDVQEAVNSMQDGDIILLENLRFHKEEKKNDETFAQQLASLADFYVNDAFGTCHRAHASVHGVTQYLPSAAGFLVEKELDIMAQNLAEPPHPYIAIIGGAKMTDKIGVIKNLLPKVDTIILGGALIFNFYKAQGFSIGASKYDDESVALAKELAQNEKIMLPIDLIVADKFADDAHTRIVPATQIPERWMGLDIGPESLNRFKEIIQNAKMVVWGGPMGVFELDNFATGTLEIANALAHLDGITIGGGGDTVAAVEKAGVQMKMTHVSTGGGAALELIEGKQLPGIVALQENYEKYQETITQK